MIASGVELLAQAAAPRARTVHEVDWRPPMPGTEAELATVLADRRRAEANAEAVRRITETQALLVDVVPAGPTWACPPTTSCMPDRRSVGTGRPARCGARCSVPPLFEGSGG